MQKSLIAILALLIFGCASEDASSNPALEADILDLSTLLSIDFNTLDNYSDQSIPPYIIRDNTPSDNFITDKAATLGRILFYDTNLSTDNTVSCASCHKQNFAFGDNLSVSVGVDGTTGRHSMRLINSRFSDESKFFWDERASSLEVQTTMPVKDHIEMGFSGDNGDLAFTDLIARLENTDYYPQLFNLVYGNVVVNETKTQNALAQFVRSIQSFDSKYDEGRLLVNNDNQPFPNFTQQENLGKQLFLQPPVFDNQGSRINGGIGCAGCHQAPEFSIDPNSLNNGVIGTASQTGTDLTVTRSPSLRDVVKADGTSNGQFMHIGISNNLATVMNHYDEINLAGNTNLDPRLQPNGVGQQLNLTDNERNAVIAFIRTLAGNDVYINTKWSNPFIN